MDDWLDMYKTKSHSVCFTAGRPKINFKLEVSKEALESREFETSKD